MCQLLGVHSRVQIVLTLSIQKELKKFDNLSSEVKELVKIVQQLQEKINKPEKRS